MECNRTFISIKQLEEQDISAEKICSLLSQLYDDLAGYEHALEVNDLNAFRSHMSTLLNRVLNLYKTNEDSLSKSGVFQRIKNRELEVEEYQRKVDDLKEELEKIDELNHELKDKTKDYNQIKDKNKELESQNQELKAKIKELEKINLEKLEEDNKNLENYISQKEESYKTLNEDNKNLKNQLEDLRIKYDQVLDIYKENKKQNEQLSIEINEISRKEEELRQEKELNKDKLEKLEKLENIQKEVNSIKDNNKALDSKIDELEDILGIGSNDEIVHLDRLNSMRNRTNEYLKEYLKNNEIEELEEQIDLNGMDIIQYLHFIDNLVINNRRSITTYYNLTLELRTMISEAISTSREDDD